MDLQHILRLMQNAGFRVIGADARNVYIEDPACILRAFATFAEYAWIALVCATGLLLFGWAISLIRGAKNDIFTNMRNLILIFGITAAAGPIINVIYGDDLFAKGCKTVQIQISEVQQLLDARNAKLSKRDDLYEDFDIYDTGANISVTGQDIDQAAQAPANNTTPDAANRPLRAYASGNDVVYISKQITDEGGGYESKTRRSQGTRAWRNNNPGNIRPGKFTSGAGDIGQAGNFAVFPDEQTGMNAIVRLLKTDRYQNKTLAGAISAWAPPSDGNNTSSYQRSVERATGVSSDTPMRQLNDEQIASVAREIRRVEGWRPGRETHE